MCSTSSKRRRKAASDPGDPPYEHPHMRMELDSHADTCCLDEDHCVVVQDTGRTVTVEGFGKAVGKVKGIRIVTAAVAYDCPISYQTFILIFHESLLIRQLQHHLINPLQLRNRGLVVNEALLQHMDPASRNTHCHSILCKDPALHIPLSLRGTMSGFQTRVPTQAELADVEQKDVTFVTMTSSEPWEPTQTTHSSIEDSLREELLRGTTLVHQEPRELDSLQVRGLEDGAQAEGTLEFKPRESKLAGYALDFDDDWTQGTAMSTDVESLSDPNTSIGFEDSFEPQHPEALDVDRHAGSLMRELGVPDDEDSVQGIEAVARHVAMATTTKERAGFVDAQKLAKNWKIGFELAKKTLDATTQLAVRDFTHTSGGRRLKPLHWVLKQPRLSCEVYTDTLFGKCRSLRGNKCAQIFATPFHYVRAFPMKKEKEAHEALDMFFHQVGVPHVMVSDGAKAEKEGEFLKKCRKAQCPVHPTEPYTPNANLAEGVIREIKRHYRRVMVDTGAPEVIWDDCVEWVTLVRCHTALNIKQLDGMTPATMMTGDTSDISHLAEFGWYDWVWYIDIEGKSGQEATQSKSMERKKLGRYIGPSINVGDAMCGKVLTEKAERIHRTSIIPLSMEDQNSEAVKQRKKVFTDVLEAKLRDRIKAIKGSKTAKQLEREEREWLADEITPEHVPHEEWSPMELGFDIPTDESKQEPPEIADAEDLDLNKYISAKVMLPKDGHTFASGRVVKRARDENGELIGKTHDNPLLDSSVYEIRFEDGSVERYHANIIAEHIYSQVDGDGYGRALLDEIIDHKTDGHAVTKENGFIEKPGGNRVPKQTTKGWWLLARLKDHSTQWFKLKDLKESNPLQVAEYVKNNQLEDEPAFKWWVPFTIRKRNRILSAMRKRYFRIQQKFGIEIPKNVERALQIDKETGTTFWRDAIAKEMKTVMIAFDIKPEGADRPVGYTFAKCHLVFDVKQGTLQRKARFVLDGSRIDTDNVPTYASVVSRESVRIAFTLAALNDLNVLAADCEGAYLNAPTREKLFTRCGPEFGEMQGRWAIIVRALYGSKSAAASWRATISGIIEGLGFKMCRADNDVWMRPGENSKGDKVYEYVLVYSDDLLIIAMNPMEIAAHIDQHCKLKTDSVKRPDQYLGANIGVLGLANGRDSWYMSSEAYCKAAIQNVEAWLQKRKERLPTRTACVFPSGWKPETDVTPELNDTDTSYYQQQVGVLRWMVELGRLDICTEVSMLAAFSACPRQGHLAAILHLFGYLKKNPRSKLVFDPTPMDHEPQEEPDWKDFYGEVKELVPSDAPECRGKSIQMTAFVDSDHAGDLVNRRSRTGVLIFLGMAPIAWLSKKQLSVEASSYGSELAAMKTCVEMVEGLRYKLRMMGVELEGRTHIKADNMSVIHNCSNPASQLKKKSNSIAYHYVRERCAAGVCGISYIPTLENLADMFTKSQPGETRKRLAEKVLY